MSLVHSNIEIYYSSKCELPESDSNIKILFDCLDITTVIKLWCSILLEKQIIIIANQTYLLFSICEALMKLIFPFKWLYPYIPILPKSKLDYLEAPTPYIMGILSCNADFQYLRENFPEHVICDVDTSQIFCKNLTTLPTLEQNKLRRKLQFVKNPEIFDIEELMSEVSKTKTYIEDICADRTFSSNVQYIFFRPIRRVFGNFQKRFMQGKVFDEERFLEELINEEEKLFWGKIIHTCAFENFVVANQYLDDSFTKIFKKIIKHEDSGSQKGVISFGVNYLPIIKMYQSILEGLKAKEPSSEGNRDIAFMEKLISDCKVEEGKSKRPHFLSDLSDSIVKSEGFMAGGHLKKSIYTFSTPETCLKYYNKCNKKVLQFYGSKGFVTFMNTLYDLVCDDFLNSIYRDAILTELSKLTGISDAKKLRISKIDEIDSEGELEPSCRTSEIILDSRGSLQSEFGYKAKNRKEVAPFFDMVNSDSPQFHLLIASYLCHFQSSRRDEILKHYTHAYRGNKKEFPYYKFYLFLSNFNLENLREIRLDDKKVKIH
jgi:hypothetical protein